MIVSRLDYGTMTRPEKTAQGYLKAPCFATRTGIFIYRGDNGLVRREYRPDDEVFNPDSLKTLSGIPVTDDHPPVMLDANNTAEYARGYTGDLVERNGDMVGVPVTITSADLIASVDSREKSETSCGYTCDLDETPGVFNGAPYDAIQRKIRYNHLAIVSRGRAGPQVKIRMDSGAVQVFDQLLGDYCMTKIRIDELDFEVSEPAALAITAKIKKDAMSIEEIQLTLTALQSEIEKLKGEKAGMEIEMDACKTAKDVADAAANEMPKMDTAAIHTAAMARLELIKIAEKAVPTVKLDSLSDKEIKVAVIVSRKPDFKADGLSDDFVAGLFNGLSQSESRVDALGAAITAGKETAPGTIVDARAKSMNESKNAWKKQ